MYILEYRNIYKGRVFSSIVSTETGKKQMTFKQYNHNPSGKKVGDCVIRAIGKALGVSWERVFEDLTNIAREKKSVLNCPDVYTEYLKIYQTIPVKYGEEIKKRYIVKDICSWKGTYVITLANHLTCIVDGINYDLWDCGKKSAYKIWKIK